MNYLKLFIFFSILCFCSKIDAQDKAGDEALGTKKYDDYKTPEFCGASCHVDIYQQWKQVIMSQAYTHQ